MAMAYPATLPAPLLEGHAISAGQDTIRTDMETGAARQRRRSFSSPDRVNLAWVFNSTQFAVFRAWYDGEINGGGAWFTLPIDDGVLGYATPRDVRFVESFEASKLGSQMWRVSIKAEIRRQRLSSFDHLNLLGLPSLDLDFAVTKSLAPVITSARQPTPSITFTRASTATYVGPDGLIKTAAINEPRFDHDPVSLACKGLLIEETRTNYLLGDVARSSATISTGTALSPDGGVARKAVCPSGVASFPSICDASVQTMTVGIGGTIDFFFSAYIAAGVSGMAIEPLFVITTFTSPSSNYAYALCQVNTGSMSVRSKSLDAVFTEIAAPSIVLTGTGMYKFTWGVRFTQGAITRNVWTSEIQLCNTAGSGSYTGDGVGHFQFFAPQLEIGSFPTSYIPTTTSAVTRSVDSASMDGANFSSWYSQEAGTFFCRFDRKVASASTRSPGVFSVENSAMTHRITLIGGYSFPASQRFDVTVDSVAVAQPVLSSSVVDGNQYAAACAYAVNDYAGSMAGAAVASDNSGALPSVSKLKIGEWGSASSQVLTGHIARLTYYPKRLSNAQLQGMTV